MYERALFGKPDHVFESSPKGSKWQQHDIVPDKAFGGGYDSVDVLIGIGVGPLETPSVYVGIWAGKYSGKPIFEIAQSGKLWRVTDLNAVAGAPYRQTCDYICGGVAGGIDAMSAGSLREPRVYYIASDMTVAELACSDELWTYTNLTASVPAGIHAVGGTPVACMGAGPNNDPRVYYLAEDGCIHEFSSWQQSWHDRNLIADASGAAPPAIVNYEYEPGYFQRFVTPLTCMGATLYNEPRVYYYAADGRIHELSCWNGAWQSAVISSTLAVVTA
jgi:hypothetical protein